MPTGHQVLGGGHHTLEERFVRLYLSFKCLGGGRTAEERRSSNISIVYQIVMETVLEGTEVAQVML